MYDAGVRGIGDSVAKRKRVCCERDAGAVVVHPQIFVVREMLEYCCCVINNRRGCMYLFCIGSELGRGNHKITGMIRCPRGLEDRRASTGPFRKEDEDEDEEEHPERQAHQRRQLQGEA